MKLVFLFPFVNYGLGRPLKWVPLSTPTLTGNVKDDFPEIEFTQIDMEEEVKHGIASKKFNARYAGIPGICAPGKNAPEPGERIAELRDFFNDLINYLRLDEYDHYLFSFYNRSQASITASLLFSGHLKGKFKNKKIIFGGILGFGDNYFRRSFPEYDLVDSFVIGRGEGALRDIIARIEAGAPIPKIYEHALLLPSDTFGKLPDFGSFVSLRHFEHSARNLEKTYGQRIKLSEFPDSRKKILFLPYSFSQGCFWGRCAYCNNSGSKRARFCHKEVSEITEELIRLKRIYRTKYFIFYNNNFNFDPGFAKALLRDFIRKKLEILWTDSFNLVFLDDELIDLLAEAGCFRMDLGLTTADPTIQKRYHNILRDNRRLDNLRKISSRGIWTYINLIANMPHQYRIEEELNALDKYMEHIDGAQLNSYRRYAGSDLSVNFEKYNLKPVQEKVHIDDEKLDLTLSFMEKDFPETMEERKRIFKKNYIYLRDFFSNHAAFPCKYKSIDLYLLGYLYNALGHDNKNKIKETVVRAAGKEIKYPA